MSKGGGYDPLGYGQVRLAQSNQPQGEGRDKSPEDLLFDGSQAAFAPPTGGDNEWGMNPGPAFVPGAGSGALDDLDLAGDILGVKNQSAAAAKPAAPATPAPGPRSSGIRPPAAGRPTPSAATPPIVGSAPAPRAPAPRPVAAATVRPPAVPADAQAATARPQAPARPAPKQVLPAPAVAAAARRPERRSLLGYVVPAAVLVGGASAALYLHWGMGNTFLAAVSAGLALVGAAFAWCFTAS